VEFLWGRDDSCTASSPWLHYGSGQILDTVLDLTLLDTFVVVERKQI
jgi:hypothetical protein